MAQHVGDLQDVWVSFTASAKQLVHQGMCFEQVRCPLDVRIKEVEVTRWFP